MLVGKRGERAGWKERVQTTVCRMESAAAGVPALLSIHPRPSHGMFLISSLTFPGAQGCECCGDRTQDIKGKGLS